MTSPLRYVARRTARIGLVATVAVVLGLIAVQFESIVAKNLSVAQQVSAVHREIAALRERERAQQRAVERLGDPRGAIPEIHEKLGLVRPHEELIYVRGLAQPTARPDDAWAGSP